MHAAGREAVVCHEVQELPQLRQPRGHTTTEEEGGLDRLTRKSTHTRIRTIQSRSALGDIGQLGRDAVPPAALAARARLCTCGRQRSSGSTSRRGFRFRRGAQARAGCRSRCASDRRPGRTPRRAGAAPTAAPRDKLAQGGGPRRATSSATRPVRTAGGWGAGAAAGGPGSGGD